MANASSFAMIVFVVSLYRKYKEEALNATPSVHIVPPAGDAEGWKGWSECADKAIHRADQFSGMGMSGAQAGAAKSLALQLISCGPRAFLEGLKKTSPERADDIIQVSRDWPRVALDEDATLREALEKIARPPLEWAELPSNRLVLVMIETAQKALNLS